MAYIAREELVARLKDLFVSSRYCDFTITCSGNAYNVHKAIVCSQSEFFHKAESFPVGKEAAERSIDLPDDDPVVVKLLVSFFYEAEYEPRLPVISQKEEEAGISTVTVPKEFWYTYSFPHTCGRVPSCDLCPHHQCEQACPGRCQDFCCEICTAPQPPAGDSTQLLLHAKMYAIGDKYDIPALRDLACEKFDRTCRRFWNDEQFPITAAYVLEALPDNDNNLRSIIINTVVWRTQILDSPAMEAVLLEHPDFIFAIAKRLAKRGLGYL